MVRLLVQRWRDWREQRALARRPIPDALWRRVLRRYPFLPAEGTADEAELRRLSRLFLDRKEFTGAHGLVVTDDMAVSIAAQACLPVLALGLEPYEGFVGIVVHPGAARAWRSRPDADGIVHEYHETLAGEAVYGGPVMLSWRDVRAGGARAASGFNVVIHEFAHVIDMAHGHPDGRPLLPPEIDPAAWDATFAEAQRHLERDEAAGLDTVLDPYGLNGREELFAVASESFFVDSERLRAAEPALYSLLSRFYRQDPAERPSGRGLREIERFPSR